MPNTFPTTLNDWADEEAIESGWADSLEAKIGADNSNVPTSLDYLVKNTLSIDPGHRHSKVYEPDNSAVVLETDNSGRVGVGLLGGAFNIAAAFEIKSTTGGLLPPRVTTAQRNVIGNLVAGTAGLMVFDTDLQSLMVFTWINEFPLWQRIPNSGVVSYDLMSETLNYIMDARRASVHSVNLGGNNFELENIQNGYAGQHLTLIFNQGNPASTVTLDPANFKFGTDITGYTATAVANKKDYVAVVFTGLVWNVIAASKGF